MSEHGINTLNIQVVWEKCRYLKYSLSRKENVSKIPVKDPADNLYEKMLLLGGVIFVSAVISTQLNVEGILLELTPHGLDVVKDG